jgi:ribosomal protein S18 acetylase RimI-like enzyme
MAKNNYIKTFIRTKIFATSILILLFLISLIIYQRYQINQVIFRDYNELQDMKPILNLFKYDWYLLVSSQDFSPEYMLKSSSPNDDLKYRGKLVTKVLTQQNNFLGFTAYYPEKNNIWRLLFLAVDKDQRGKKYGEKLLNLTIEDIKKRGAEKIYLTTRTDNTKARSLYEKNHFKEISKDDKFVYYGLGY